MPLSDATALQRLRSDPRAFLQTYVVRTAGATTRSDDGIAPALTYYIENKTAPAIASSQGFASTSFAPPRRPGRILKTRRMHATEEFKITTVQGGQPFTAYSIPMCDSDQDQYDFYSLPSNGGGVDIMVTGVLSGCCFLVDVQQNGDLRCAHLQPKNETGAVLHDRLERTGNYTVAYGRNNYNHLADPQGNARFDRHVTVVGVHSGGSWKIYAQKQDRENQYSIRSVHRIYPT